MALYHIHRPQTFEGILGQDHVKQTLREQVKADNVAHAYLFSGPRGVGKTSTARILAKAVNAGIDKKGEVLDNDIATSITEGATIDIIEIDAASNTGVDNVREQIIENAQFRPTTLTKKVFIIDEVHMLSTSAFNALLKVLEEPPAYVMFILATTEPHKLPATIISRCQRFDFRPIPFDILKPHLAEIANSAKITVDEPVLDRIVAKSSGCARDAVSLLDQVMSIGKKKITAEDVHMILPVSDTASIAALVRNIVHKERTAALAHITSEVANGTHMRQFAEDCTKYLRYMLLSSAGSDISTIATELSAEAIDALKQTAADISQEDLLLLIDTLMKRSQDIARAPLPQLPLEMLIIWWCGDNTHTPTAPNNATPATSTAPTPKPAQSAPAPEQREIVAPEAPTEQVASTGHVWNDIMAAVEKQSPSLVFILKSASHAVADNTVTINVTHTFHKDKLESADTMTLLRKAAGDDYAINVTLATGTAPPPDTSAESNTDLADLAAAFGGKIVS